MSDPYIGQIISVGFNFAPLNWAYCNGQLFSISQFDALFTLIGTTYGGDGISTFGIPDLRGRVPVHQGPSSPIGLSAGTESITLDITQLPAHTHLVQTATQPGTTNTASTSTVLSDVGGATFGVYQPPDPANQTPLSPASVGSAGQNMAHENRQPYLPITYAICLQGIFPPFG